MKPLIFFLLLTSLSFAQSSIQEKSLHIDFVQFLEESGEYALKLSFLPDANTRDWYDSLEFHFTQPKIEQGSEYQRYDAPLALIERYFHIDRLHEMKIYSDENRFLGEGIFQGFEYINQSIELKVVAVYRTSEVSLDTAIYAICGLEETLSSCPPKYYEKSESLRKLQAALLSTGAEEHHSLEVGNCTDFHFMAPQGYKVTSETEENYSVETFAQLYVEHAGKIQAVHQLYDGWLYWHLQPLAINHKDYPIILLEKAMMDSDWFMQSILLWNGIAYEENDVRFEVREE